LESSRLAITGVMLERLRSVVTSLAIASVIGSAAQAYASTSIQANPAGARISTPGVAVRDVHYASSGAAIQAVLFQVDEPGVSVSIRLNEAGGWYPCLNQDGSVRCDVHDFPASAVEELGVARRS
jgi:hypothetical protein